jgi:hypothetical protein
MPCIFFFLNKKSPKSFRKIPIINVGKYEPLIYFDNKGASHINPCYYNQRKKKKNCFKDLLL